MMSDSVKINADWSQPTTRCAEPTGEMRRSLEGELQQRFRVTHYGPTSSYLEYEWIGVPTEGDE